mmetsp:Transcript_6672/g.16836  ORF Transcript_6672/g.16836 Transcript_6672/m.16836 type:complete len:388 (-) Transcript_6672:348-1511(-)
MRTATYAFPPFFCDLESVSGRTDCRFFDWWSDVEPLFCTVEEAVLREAVDELTAFESGEKDLPCIFKKLCQIIPAREMEKFISLALDMGISAQTLHRGGVKKEVLKQWTVKSESFSTSYSESEIKSSCSVADDDSSTDPSGSSQSASQSTQSSATDSSIWSCSFTEDTSASVSEDLSDTHLRCDPGHPALRTGNIVIQIRENVSQAVRIKRAPSKTVPQLFFPPCAPVFSPCAPVSSPCAPVFSPCAPVSSPCASACSPCVSEEGSKEMRKSANRRRPSVKWTKERGLLLEHLINQQVYKMDGKSINWKEVASQFNLLQGTEVDGAKLAQRWRRVQNPSIKKDPWTSKEEALLSVAVSEFGPQWSRISKFLPGRTEILVSRGGQDSC